MGKNLKSPFGQLLVEMISDAKLTQEEFYVKLGIKKPYFYDIIAGKINPPPAEKQFKIISILNPSDEKKADFFELAAKGRNELPADIARYIETSQEYNAIRRSKSYKNMMKDIMKETKWIT